MSRKLAIAFVLIAILAAMALPFSPVLAQDQPVVITWFIGLGAGGQPEHRALQDEIVAAFNAAHDDIELEHVVVDFDASRDTLSTLIAAGDAPDIIGPVGIGGSNDYAGSFLDLDPIIEELDYDLGRWAPSLIDFYRDPVEGLTGLPFATFPSFVFFNRDLFDAAGVDYPPQTFGEPYADGDPWDVDKLREIAMLLTLDATTGQNALQQVRTFKEMVAVSGLAVTKLDGSAKGGVVVALAQEIGLPVHFVGVGEKAADLRPFTAADYARGLVGLGQ